MDISKILDRTPRQLYYLFQKKINHKSSLQQFNDDHPCVFVLSTGRVGTKTLSNLFQFAPNVISYHEPNPKLYGLSKLAYQYSEDWIKSQKIWQETFKMARHELFSYSFYCHKGYVETSPQMTFLAPIILQAIPDVRFIHIVRDPRAVVRSAMRRKWYEGNVADSTRIIPNDQSAVKQKWGSFTPFQKNIWLWAETNKWIRDFFSKLPDKQKLTIYSEDIFIGKQEVIEQIFAFIDSPIPDQKKVLALMKKRLNFQRIGDFPETHKWSQSMENELQFMAGKIAKEIGYDI